MNIFKIKVFYRTQRNVETLTIGNIKAPNVETAIEMAIGGVMMTEKSKKDRYLKICDVIVLEEETCH
jgi:hypothetical protein